MLHEALGHLHHLVELAKADVTIEDDPVKVIGLKTLGYHHSLPVFSPAGIVL